MTSGLTSEVPSAPAGTGWRRRILPGRTWGVRTRLVVAFGVLCVVTAVAVAVASYRQARLVILQQAQDAAVSTLTNRLQALYPLRGVPPDQSELDGLAQGLSDRNNTAMAVYRGLRSTPALPPDAVSGELREVVGNGVVAWQRVAVGGQPYLMIGAQLRITVGGTTKPSGIEVYDQVSLLSEQQSIAVLTSNALLAGAVALGLAVALALLAAQGVLRPVRELGRAARRLGTGDLTTRIEVRGTDELAQAASTFNTTAAQLEQHVADLRAMEADARRFVADVSHELRTPLAAMIAVVDVLDEEAPDLSEPAARAARLVSRETQHLARLVNDLIEISRLDAGTARLALDEVDVAEAIRGSLRARAWTDRVETDLPDGITATLDPRRLDVIMSNLVGNALHHGRPPVRVTLSAEPDRITVEVRDHGPGLAPDVLPHVFDRFYKADVARTRSEGSGLGLAIARQNARLHQGGDLTAANHPEGGALFTLHLPRTPGTAT